MILTILLAQDRVNCRDHELLPIFLSKYISTLSPEITGVYPLCEPRAIHNVDMRVWNTLYMQLPHRSILICVIPTGWTQDRPCKWTLCCAGGHPSPLRRLPAVNLTSFSPQESLAFYHPCLTSEIGNPASPVGRVRTYIHISPCKFIFYRVVQCNGQILIW
jgi:hypothetical protein